MAEGRGRGAPESLLLPSTQHSLGWGRPDNTFLSSTLQTVSHNTKRFRFALPTPHHILGLPVGKESGEWAPSTVVLRGRFSSWTLLKHASFICFLHTPSAFPIWMLGTTGRQLTLNSPPFSLQD